MSFFYSLLYSNKNFEILKRQETEGGWLLTSILPPVQSGIFTKNQLGKIMMGFCNNWDIEIIDSEIEELVEFYAEGQFFQISYRSVIS